MIGPTIGGVLFQLGRGLPFLVDAVSYAISAVSLLFIRADFQTATGRKDFRLRTILQGAKWLWHHAEIRPIALARAFGAIVSGGQTLLVILLAQQFDATPAMIGIIFSVSSIGVVLGALISDYVQEQLGVHRALVLSRWVIALALPLQFFSPNLIILTLTVTLSYFSVAVYGTIATAYRLKIAPDELQGRINGFHRMLAFGGLTIGGVLTGLLVEQLDLRITFIVYALLLGALAASLTNSLLRTED